ncbi:hypothetical protein BFP70_07970 [Thioclava sp. SK-1]|uniref:DUF2484 family protein n=1 Tax=Thioclava sp. SK-1 TaxID=1889770 RepID=UPI0008263A81|nr:DUF2484 family protein [Thioclava sp. SK-1]OCX66043.1 hypothetical protein BFP70_07970 [Thioclava sp. SK-1]
MTHSLFAVCLWVIAATMVALGPQRFHWPAAWALIATGVPMVGWVTYQNGPLWGVLVLAGGVSVLRWPVKYLLRAAREGRFDHD